MKMFSNFVKNKSCCRSKSKLRTSNCFINRRNILFAFFLQITNFNIILLYPNDHILLLQNKLILNIFLINRSSKVVYVIKKEYQILSKDIYISNTLIRQLSS